MGVLVPARREHHKQRHHGGPRGDGARRDRRRALHGDGAGDAEGPRRLRRSALARPLPARPPRGGAARDRDQHEQRRRLVRQRRTVDHAGAVHAEARLDGDQRHRPRSVRGRPRPSAGRARLLPRHRRPRAPGALQRRAYRRDQGQGCVRPGPRLVRRPCELARASARADRAVCGNPPGRVRCRRGRSDRVGRAGGRMDDPPPRPYDHRQGEPSRTEGRPRARMRQAQPRGGAGDVRRTHGEARWRRRAAGRKDARLDAHRQLGGRQPELDAETPRGVPRAPRLRSAPLARHSDRHRRRQPRGLRALPVGPAPDDLRPAARQLRRCVPRDGAQGRPAPLDRGLHDVSDRRDGLRRTLRRADVRVLVVELRRRHGDRGRVQLHRNGLCRACLRPARPRRRGLHRDERGEVAGTSCEYQGPRRLGLLRGREPVRVPSLRAAAVDRPRPRAGRFDGAVGSALRAHADVVGDVRRMARLPRAVPAHAAAGRVRRGYLPARSRGLAADARRATGLPVEGGRPRRHAAGAPRPQLRYVSARGAARPRHGPRRPHRVQGRCRVPHPRAAARRNHDPAGSSQGALARRGRCDRGRQPAAEVAESRRVPGVRRRGPRSRRRLVGRRPCACDRHDAHGGEGPRRPRWRVRLCAPAAVRRGRRTGRRAVDLDEGGQSARLVAAGQAAVPPRRDARRVRGQGCPAGDDGGQCLRMLGERREHPQGPALPAGLHGRYRAASQARREHHRGGG